MKLIKSFFKFKITQKILFFTLLFIGSLSRAEILFEGYYKVTQFKKHIGYYVLRQEFNPKLKTFETKSYLNLSKNGFNMSETLTTVSNEKFAPLSYSYIATDSSNGHSKNKTIEGEVKNNTLQLTLTENSEKSKFTTPLKADSFFSNILYYYLMNTKQGLKTNTTIKFEAIEEESGLLKKGQTRIETKMVTKGKNQLLKVLNNFSDLEYENQISPTGQNIYAFIPTTQIESELVKNKEEALDDIKLSPSTLEKIFGNTPEGKINLLNK